MVAKKIENVAYKYALQNAIQFDGKADIKAVIGKTIAVLKEDKFSPNDIIPVVRSVVDTVNRLSLEEQTTELQNLAPELLIKEKRDKEIVLPSLPNAVMGKVVTRFPPEPNGFLHIGHAKAAIVDQEYARMYDGKFILRFDDTNPENAKLEFYDVQREDLQWLGIEWDEEYNTSDHLEQHYKLAEQLISQGDAYVCKCLPEDIKHGRFYGKECMCRRTSCGENVDIWKDMISSSTVEGAILRLKGDLTCTNTAMRDPTLFRIIETEHPIQGSKYRVWPTYDFAGAIEDSLSGVTHPFRTKEYELRDECYFYILNLLNLRKPHLMEFSRLSIEGMPVSKRKIKPLIDTGKVTGYDDVRLPTLRGLRRRGILVETIKQFVISQGISKAESSVTFDQVEAINRKIIDSRAKRYFFVPQPVKLIVENAPTKTITLKLHPTEKLGEKTITTNNIFFISDNDVQKLKIGDIFRLKDLYNVKIKEKNDKIIAEFAGENLLPDINKIQWTTKNYVPFTVYKPHPLFINEKYNENSLEKIEGYAEEAIKSLKTDEIIQFERFAFVRIEKKDGNLIGFFTHK